MAFVDSTQAGEDQQNPSQVDQVLNPSATQQSQQAQQQTQAAPPSTSAGGAGVASAGSAAPAGSPSSATPKPSSSGSWTNLDSYLGANSDQATQMGQQIAQSVNTAGNQAQTDIGNIGSNFNNAVAQNTVQQNAGAVNQAITDADSLSAGNSLSSADQQAYNAQANASYGGPNDVTAFGGYNQAQQDVNAANQAAQETQSEAGRGTLLNNQYQNASQYGYTQGENNLDQLLLQNSTGAQQALQPLQQQWSGLTGALNNTVQTGDASAQAASATDQATAAAAQNSLNTATQNWQSQINTGLANLQQTDQNSYNQILGDMNNRGLTAADYQALGIDPNAHIYGGVDSSGNPTGTVLSNYLTEGQQPNLADYASANQYAQAQALAQLAGQQQSGFLNPGTATQAGTAQNQPAYTFDSTRMQSDNATNQAAYTQDQANLMKVINNGIKGPGSGEPLPFDFSSIQDAVNGFNQIIQQYGTLDPNTNGYGAMAQFGRQQLAQINATQAAYGFPLYPVADQQAGEQTGGLNTGGQSVPGTPIS